MRKFFKKSLACVLAVGMLVACIGCGEESKTKNVDVNAMATSLKSDITYVDTLTECDKDFMAMIFELDGSLVVNQKTYFNGGASAEAAVVVECKDSADAAKIKTAFESYAKKQADVYRSYNPTEADKLDKAVVEVVGDKYVAFCVSGDSNKAKEIIEK